MENTYNKLNDILNTLQRQDAVNDQRLGDIKKSIDDLDASIKEWLTGELFLVNDKIISIAVLVGIANIICGISVLTQPGAYQVTSFYVLWELDQLFQGGSLWVGGILIGSGVLSLFGTVNFHIPWYIRFLFFIPQQILMGLQLISISIVLANGAYPDGYVPVGGAWFILKDQIWAWVLAIAHTFWFISMFNKSKHYTAG